MFQHKWSLTFVAASLLLSSCAATVPADTHDADLRAIKETEASWVKDAATKDVDKWVAHYTEDASVLLPDQPLFTGRDAIRGALKPMMSDPNFAVTFAAAKIGVAKSGEMAFTEGPYSLTLTDPKTHAAVIEKGKYLTVYMKQADGAWKGVEDTFMSDSK